MYARRRTFAALAAAALLTALTFTAVALGKTTLRASLSGRAEVPTGPLGGSGKARITLDDTTGKVCWSFTGLRGFSGANAAHIHKGPAGKAGGVVVPLGAGFKASGCQTGVRKSLIKQIARTPRGFYVNIHSGTYPAGAVRGQLRR